MLAENEGIPEWQVEERSIESYLQAQGSAQKEQVWFLLLTFLSWGGEACWTYMKQKGTSGRAPDRPPSAVGSSAWAAELHLTQGHTFLG